MNTAPRNIRVPCPVCHRPASFDAARNPWRPFCSERCKHTDLGAWASESYSVGAVDLGDDGEGPVAEAPQVPRSLA